MILNIYAREYVRSTGSVIAERMYYLPTQVEIWMRNGRYNLGGLVHSTYIEREELIYHRDREPQVVFVGLHSAAGYRSPSRLLMALMSLGRCRLQTQSTKNCRPLPPSTALFRSKTGGWIHTQSTDRCLPVLSPSWKTVPWTPVESCQPLEQRTNHSSTDHKLPSLPWKTSLRCDPQEVDCCRWLVHAQSIDNDWVPQAHSMGLGNNMKPGNQKHQGRLFPP